MAKILVIDDEPIICEMLEECLRDIPGMEVQCALNGAAGAEALRNVRFDLAVIDGHLGSVSGLELAALAANGNIPVLFISGDAETNADAEQLGYRYLAKPFSLQQLLFESERLIAEAREHTSRARESTAGLKATADALTSAMGDSQRLLGGTTGSP